MATAASDDSVKVFCGEVEGMLDPTRFGPGCKSRCIEHRGRWLTPPEFELLAGKSKHYRWRRNIKTESGTRFGELMENGFLKECAKNCICDVCDGDGVAQKVTPPTTTTSPPMTSLTLSPDTDSDSGISTVSSTNNYQSSLLKTVSPAMSQASPPSVGFENVKDALDYPSMVQEAIASLDGGQTDCTNLNILLYILNRHNPHDDIATVNTKVSTALSFLVRMGLVKKSGDDGEDNDDLDESDVNENVVQTPLKSNETDEQPKKETSNHVSVTKKSIDNNKKTVEHSKAKVKGLVVAKSQSLNGDAIKRPPVIYKPKKLSPALAAICGKKKMTRPEALKRVWKYIKLKKLQEPEVKTQIRCDEKLKLVMKKKRVDQREIFALINVHMTDV